MFGFGNSAPPGSGQFEDAEEEHEYPNALAAHAAAFRAAQQGRAAPRGFAQGYPAAAFAGADPRAILFMNQMNQQAAAAAAYHGAPPALSNAEAMFIHSQTMMAAAAAAAQQRYNASQAAVRAPHRSALPPHHLRNSFSASLPGSASSNASTPLPPRPPPPLHRHFPTNPKNLHKEDADISREMMSIVNTIPNMTNPPQDPPPKKKRERDFEEALLERSINHQRTHDVDVDHQAMMERSINHQRIHDVDHQMIHSTIHSTTHSSTHTNTPMSKTLARNRSSPASHRASPPSYYRASPPASHRASPPDSSASPTPARTPHRPNSAITAAMLESATPQSAASAPATAPTSHHKHHHRNFDEQTQKPSPPKPDPSPENGFDALLAASFRTSSDAGDADSQPSTATKTRKSSITSTPASEVSKSAKKMAMAMATPTSPTQSSPSTPAHSSNVTTFTTASYRCSVVPLALAEDKYWLSDLQCYIRQHYVEVFGATEEDLTHTLHGRSKPTFIGQVGIRCQFCKTIHANERGQHHVYYPALISGVYNCVQQMLRMHLDCCTHIPQSVREKIDGLRCSSSARGGRKQYWIDSAKKLGLCDTSRGILFERDPLLSKQEADAAEGTSGRNCTITAPILTTPTGTVVSASELKDMDLQDVPSTDETFIKIVTSTTDIKPTQPSPAGNILLQQQVTAIPDKLHMPLVLSKDKHLIAEVLYVTFQNMHPVPIVESDQVGCYKSRPLGFIGLACNHCIGQAGCGRYFPANEASLSQTTTSQTLLNHVRKCRGAPPEVRNDLDKLMRTKLKKGEKPRHGGRKVFFHRLWCRMQGLNEPQNDEDQLENNMRRVKNKNAMKKRPTSPGGTPLPSTASASSRKKRRPRSSSTSINAGPDHDEYSDMSCVGGSEDEESLQDASVLSSTNRHLKNEHSTTEEPKNTDSQVIHGMEHVTNDAKAVEAEANKSSLSVKDWRKLYSREPTESGTILVKKEERPPAPLIAGCAPLAQPDDAFWLSDLQCFVRSVCVEAFSATTADVEAMNHLGSMAGMIMGDHTIQVGQIGIRCKFCALAASKAQAAQDNADTETSLLSSYENDCDHVMFPTSMAELKTVVLDMMKFHTASCVNMSEEAKKTFKLLQATGAAGSSNSSKTKVNAQQYWIDAAKETGMADDADEVVVKWFRDPKEKGACAKMFDAIDKTKPASAFCEPHLAQVKHVPRNETQDQANIEEIITEEHEEVQAEEEQPEQHISSSTVLTADDMLKGMIVKKSDRRIVTDQLFFLLAQLQPCFYDTQKDRRRGRATIKDEGFPGIECRWCSTKGTGKGRYFPVSAKLFCDGTTPNIHNHLLACEWCPEDVKASLEYLNHRVYDEKSSKLTSGWRRQFYKLLWNRIHSKHNQESLGDESEDEDESDVEMEEVVQYCDQSPQLVSDADGLGLEQGFYKSSSTDDAIEAAARWLTELANSPATDFLKDVTKSELNGDASTTTNLTKQKKKSKKKNLLKKAST